MSYEGTEIFTFAVVPEAELDGVLVELAKPASGGKHARTVAELRYRFGGELRVVGLASVDELIELSWKSRDAGVDDDLRSLAAAKVPTALRKLEATLEDAEALADDIIEVTDEGEPEPLAARLPAIIAAGADTAAAKSNSERLAQVLLQLSAVLAKAAKQKAAVVALHRELPA